MWNPAIAVLWESWRLTRRRLLSITTVCTLGGWLLLRGASDHSPTFLVYLVLFASAAILALSMPSIGTRAGFPFSKAFARPIRTSVLVGVPLAYVCAACAASYLVPAALLRVTTGAPFPLTSVAALIGAMAAIVAGCSWATRSATVRAGTAAIAFLGANALLQLLDPFSGAGFPVGGGPPAVGPQLCVLSGMDYLVIGALIGCLYYWVLSGVAGQRHGDEEGPSLPSADKPSRRQGDILEFLRNKCVDLVRWRCPVSSSTAAELWFELQSYGFAVLLTGVLLALCVPALLFLANASRMGIPVVLAALTILVPFMVGVSASIWNRRNSWRDQVGAFEAARPIGTARLIGVQILVASVCISGAWMLIAASFWASVPLLTEAHDIDLLRVSVIEVAQKMGIQLVPRLVLGFILLATVLAFLTAIRAFASLYAWRLWFGAAGLVVYSVAVIVAVARGWLDGAAIGAHLWVIAVAIPLGTFLVFSSALADGVLTRHQLTVASLAWLLFAALYLYFLRASGVMAAPPALAALAFASTLLPLAAVGVAPWSLSRIRHA